MGQVGFGGFRIDASIPSHKKALRQALTIGITLVDTAAVYENGQSERCVGEVLAELVEEGALTWEEVRVVSKVGRLEGELYARTLSGGSASEMPEGVVVLQEGVYAFCIHPDFIEQQLTESLERLNLSYIDTYLLHNPENYLILAKMQGTEQGQAMEEYERRIEMAFRHLEKEVEKGRIKNYGVSVNNLHLPAEAYEFHSLERLLKIAESISPSHAFSVIQIPMNFIETGGITEKNHPGETNVIQYAKQNGFTVIVNRPFDAYFQNMWFRLVDGQAVPAQSPADVNLLIEGLIDLEKELTEALALPPAPPEQPSLCMYLQQYWHAYSSFVHWDQF